MTPPAIADPAPTVFNRTWLILPFCLVVAPSLALAASYALMRLADAFVVIYLLCYTVFRLYAMVVLAPLTALGVGHETLARTEREWNGMPTLAGFAAILAAYAVIAAVANRLAGVRMRIAAGVVAARPEARC